MGEREREQLTLFSHYYNVVLLYHVQQFIYAAVYLDCTCLHYFFLYIIQDYVTLLNPSQSDRDIGEKLLEDGLAFVVKRKDRKLQALVSHISTY